MKRKLLGNKTISLFVFVFCLFEVCLSIKSLSSAAAHTHEWIYIAGLSFSMWIVTVLAIKTTSRAERCLFTAVLTVFVLHTAIAVVGPSQEIVHILRWLIMFLWIAASASAIPLFLGTRGSREEM